MQAEIITIGDEILIGQTVDTNSAWLGNKLSDYGIEVTQITSISDKKTSIINSLSAAETRADVIILTGGLGPTKDDITKKVLADYFGASLVTNAEALDNIKTLVKKFSKELLQVNIDQSLVPDNCTVLQNSRGTAPGMYFEEKGKIYISMPGVPYEMKTMMNNVVFDKLNKRSNNFALVHKTITVVGIPESHLSAAIENIENSLPSHIALAYLPHLNIIRLRLSGKSTDLDNDTLEDQIDNYFSEIKEIIGNVWFDGEFQLSEVIGAMLKKNNLTIGTIESCSGGYLAHQLTAIKGSSAYFKGSLLTYAYETKVEVADIDQEMLDTYGAVSEQVAKSMAVNARKKLGVDYCISTTGIAGPGGGTASKPIGLVYIGLAAPDGTVSVKKCQFSGTRLQVIERTAITAFEMQRQHMLAALQVTST